MAAGAAVTHHPAHLPIEDQHIFQQRRPSQNPPRTIRTTASAAASTIDTRAHISNLERVLLKTHHTPVPLSQHLLRPTATSFSSSSTTNNNLLHALNLSTLFSSIRSSYANFTGAEVSPRGLAQLNASSPIPLAPPEIVHRLPLAPSPRLQLVRPP
ncbi:hypothetical protein HPP92_014211 [Vanilla planifolia]|uniref:Uncharacterized protein n=1 Tax=Vanilla planifolia TaxID=51239 RepID=A0A835QQH8_VANPL|nr:hypothetical protein HPP92_014211 [Vanilla planifolia]